MSTRLEIRKLVFIRHAAVQIDPTVPSYEWVLSENGRSRARQLASQIAAYHPARIITSEEKKALETGQIIADALNIPWQTAPGLHEHERSKVKYFEQKGEFVTAVARFFAQPDMLVFGDEMAAQAKERFDTAVRTLIAQFPSETLAIVTHGTVLTLFLNHYNQFDPLPFWHNLHLPDIVAVTLPDIQITP